MVKKLTKEEVNERLLKSGVDVKTQDAYLNALTPMEFYCSKGHRWFAKLGSITHNHTGCPFCSGRYAIVGETDLWTTNPVVASLLLHKEDGFKYKQYSTQKVDFVCPTCGEIINCSIHTVSSKGLSCSKCSDGISYPNKFMASLLSQLQMNYISEFHLCGERYRYDFYVPSYNLIIEMHGRQHYESWKRKGRSLDEEIQNDVKKREFAINNGIKYYISIDARDSCISYISSNIQKSELSKLFNLSNVDWKKCGYYAAGSLIHEAARLYNNGYNTHDIANKLGVHDGTICNWLTKATELNLCNWVKSKGYLMEEHSVVLLNTREFFKSISDAAKKYNIAIANISSVCMHKRKYAGIHPETNEPMVWRYIEDCNENEVIDFVSLINPHVRYKTK